jgi:uncharacterized protein HemY
VAAAALLAQPAAAETSELRSLLLNGQFAVAGEHLSQDSSTALSDQDKFHRGLAAYARKDFERAASYLAEAAQTPSDPDLALRAAVVASLALSNAGDREGTCEYTKVVQPLVEDLSLLWRGWIEEARRANNCG